MAAKSVVCVCVYGLHTHSLLSKTDLQIDKRDRDLADSRASGVRSYSMTGGLGDVQICF